MFLFIAAAAAASSMTPTLENAPRRINQDGVRATYTRSTEADGTVHLRGRYHDADRTPFHYEIKGQKVAGNIGGTAVEFDVPKR